MTCYSTLQSSLKYKFKIDVETCGNSPFSESQLLLADIDIIDSQGNSLLGSKNGEESGKKKDILKGETHLSLEEKKRKPIIAKKRLNHKDERELSDSEICTGKTRTLSCTSKFQFNDVAYHHQKEFVNFKVSLYSLDGYSGKTPLLCMVSAAFQIYGRRTTEQRDEEVRRKRQYMEMKHKLSSNHQQEDVLSLKKIKLNSEHSISDEKLLQTFSNELQNLFQIFKTLTPEEQLEAYSKTMLSLIDTPQEEELRTESSVFSDPFEQACDCLYWLVDNNCPNCNHNDNQFENIFGSSEDFLTEEDFSTTTPSKDDHCSTTKTDLIQQDLCEIDIFNPTVFSDETDFNFF